MNSSATPRRWLSIRRYFPSSTQGRFVNRCALGRVLEWGGMAKVGFLLGLRSDTKYVCIMVHYAEDDKDRAAPSL